MSGRDRRYRVRFVAFVMVAAAAAPVLAQTTTYTSQSSFLAALRPGGVTNSFSDLPLYPGTPLPPARYTLGTAYAGYTIYEPTGLFVTDQSIGGGTIPKAVGTWGFGNSLFVDFFSNNVGQIGASFFANNISGALEPYDIVVRYSDGTVATVPTNMGGSGGAGYFGVSVPNSAASITGLVIPRIPLPATGAYVNMGPITTSAFDDVARFWSAAGSATTLGGEGTWSAAGSNWAVSAASIGAWDSSKRAIFGTTTSSTSATGGGTVTVDAGGISVAKGIAFNATGYVIDGPGTVTLTGTSLAANDVYVGPGVAPTIGANLSAASGFVKSGPGILRLTGTATGPVTISRGVLQVGGTSGAVVASSIVNNGELEFSRSGAVSFSGAISGSGAVFITGDGRTTLSGPGSYTGQTGILSTGTLAITSAAAVAGSVRVNTGSNGTFDVSGVAGGYAVPGGQTLVGSGTVIGATTLGGGATVSPGVARGTITMSGSLALGGGGNYNWQIDDGSLPAGQPGSYDLVSVLGGLAITASPTNTFKVNLWSVLPDGASGPALGFDSLVSSTYTLVTTTGGISGFAANKFTVNTGSANGTAGFINDLGGGTFRIAQAGNDLQLVFSPAGSSITINVASGVTQTQTAAGYPSLSGGSPVVKTGDGTLILDQANPLTATTTVQAGTLRLANGVALASSTLVPEAGGTVTLAPYLATTVGGLNPNAGGLVNVGNGSITVTSGLSVANMLTAITAGYNGGTWTGTTGITSSTAAADTAGGAPRAIGWLDNGGGSVTFAFAAPGDTNLDGLIDVLDAAALSSAARFNDTAVWSEGDFNYDGIYDDLDNALFVSTGLFDAGPYTPLSGTIAVVPEPAMPGLAGVVLAVLGWMAARSAAVSRA